MSISGDRIRECRNRRKLTLDDVAKFLGIGRQAVHKYETGIVTNIPLDNLEKMAKLFDTTPGYLAGWTEIDSPEELASVSAGVMSKDDQRLLDTYNALPPSGKDYLQQQARIARVMFGEQPIEYNQEE